MLYGGAAEGVTTMERRRKKHKQCARSAETTFHDHPLNVYVQIYNRSSVSGKATWCVVAVAKGSQSQRSARAEGSDRQESRAKE